MARSKKKARASSKKRVVPPVPRAVSTAHHRPLSRAIDRMRDLAGTQLSPYPVLVHMRVPQAPPMDTGRSHHEKKVYYRSPWAIVARFTWPRTQITYRTLYRVLKAWERSSVLEREIGVNRGSRLVVSWNKGGKKKDTGEFILSGAGPWDAVLSEALDKIDPNNRKGLSAAYDKKRGGDIVSITVWFSESSWQEYVWI